MVNATESTADPPPALIRTPLAESHEPRQKPPDVSSSVPVGVELQPVAILAPRVSVSLMLKVALNEGSFSPLAQTG